MADCGGWGSPLPPLGSKQRTYVITYNCADCGTEVTRKRTADETRICVDCGIERAAEAARQMHARAGPYYDRFMAIRHPPGRGRKPKG